MAADVSTSAGRRVGAGTTRPVGSMQAFASASAQARARCHAPCCGRGQRMAALPVHCGPAA
eukprot:3997094-Alexandrium_andersonii.AAC.1